MKARIYENIRRMTYRELLVAISNIKNNIKDANDPKILENSEYYNALVKELDSRQLEQL